MAKTKFKDRLLDARPDRLDLRDFPYRPPLRSLPARVPRAGGPEAQLPALRRGQDGARPGPGGRLHRLRPGGGRQLPALDRGPRPKARRRKATAAKGQPAHALPPGALLRRVAGRGLRRLELPRRAEGLAPPRRLRGPAVALPRQGGRRRVHRAAPTAGTATPRSARSASTTASTRARSWTCRRPSARWARSTARATSTPAGSRKTFPQRDGIACIDAAPGAENTGGHAFALVGYNRYGFIVQNSWGPSWGTKGFAILPYEDWIARGTDAWAVVLGAPIEHAESPHYHENEALVGARVAGSAATVCAGGSPAAGLARRRAVDARQRLSSRHRDGQQRHAGQSQRVAAGAVGIRRTSSSRRPPSGAAPGASRVLLYAHGGLNAEDESVKRIQVMAPYFLANGIYPIFFTWRTGVLESLDRHLRGHPARASSRRAPSATSGASSRTPSARRATAPWRSPARRRASRRSGRR